MAVPIVRLTSVGMCAFNSERFVICKKYVGGRHVILADLVVVFEWDGDYLVEDDLPVEWLNRNM